MLTLPEAVSAASLAPAILPVVAIRRVSVPLKFTAGGWVTALDERLLNREPENRGLQYWTGRLDDGRMTQQQVVLGFVQSDENFRNLTTGFFQQYLNRKPTDAELAQYVGMFKAGGSQRDVQKAIINLAEYADSPLAPGTVGLSVYPR